jgi:hypothetical protein
MALATARPWQCVVAVTVDRAARKALATADPDAIGQRLVLHAQVREPFGHDGEAIALLHAQLMGATHERFAFGAGGGDEEHRELID